MLNTQTKTANGLAETVKGQSLTKNIVQLRNGFVHIPSSKQANYQLAMSVMSELMQFGYVLDQSALNQLCAASREAVIAFHNETISYLKEMTGSNRNFRPFWKGFPDEVMEKSEYELWLHQIVHYLSNGEYEPNEWTKTRPTAFEQPKYTILKAGSQDKFLEIFTKLVSVNQSLTPDDLNIVKFFVREKHELRFPETIPFKENLCTLASMGLDVPVKTTTDVLRIAVGFSGGDISLPRVPSAQVKSNAWLGRKVTNVDRTAFKFKKFTRSERRIILNLLEKTNCDATEAVLRDQRWIRLGEVIHPGDFKNSHPKSFELFSILRDGKARSWYSKLNLAFKSSFEDGLKLLAERPGEFLRRLDWLVRKGDKNRQKLVLNTLESIAPKVSNKVTYESYQHFENRATVSSRSVMIKGKRNRTPIPELAALPKETISSIQNILFGALKTKFAALPPMGDIYVDENLKKIPLPSNMRSVSSSLRPTVRGTRTPLGNPNAKVIRLFLHWFDENGSEDLDLSGVFMGMGKVDHIGWNGIHASNQLGYYSGDVRCKRGACAEYIDIDIVGARKAGYKYCIFNGNNYQGRGLDTMKDCVVGFMEREYPSANETFVPATIANCMKLESKATNTILGMIDLETMEYIHLDVDYAGIPVASANVDAILAAIEPYCILPKLSVWHLLQMHIEARGGNVVEANKAETKFLFDDFVQSYVSTLELMGI